MTKITDFIKQSSEVLPGNETQAKLSLLGILLNRSILIEDVPGMGKTTLVKFLARITGLDFHRIQFTSDLLPSDILGISIFNKETEKFVFRPGPIFAELVLADELNRGTPKTQSALLQAMEEKVVTIDGQSFELPSRFCLIATQNPRGQFGTYPLPESQLDRFLFKFSMGHLSKEQEAKLLMEGPRSELIDKLTTHFNKDILNQWQDEIKKVTVSNQLLIYLTDLLHATRNREDFFGLSPRAGLDLMNAARGYAWISGRDYVLPDDVLFIFPYVAGHRMFSHYSLTSQQEVSRAMEIASTVTYIK